MQKTYLPLQQHLLPRLAAAQHQLSHTSQVPMVDWDLAGALEGLSYNTGPSDPRTVYAKYKTFPKRWRAIQLR